MSASSYRSSPLPRGWWKLRAQILKRDHYRCQWREHGLQCPNRATDVDHTNGPDDHRPEVLRSLCHAHHRIVTAQQGAAAAKAWRASQPSRKRPQRRHPGEI